MSAGMNELGVMRKEFHKNHHRNPLKNLKIWFITEINFFFRNFGLLQLIFQSSCAIWRQNSTCAEVEGIYNPTEDYIKPRWSNQI